jgi:hypothetical protein
MSAEAFGEGGHASLPSLPIWCGMPCPSAEASGHKSEAREADPVAGSSFAPPELRRTSFALLRFFL